jgi:hypothetical protein
MSWFELEHAARAEKIPVGRDSARHDGLSGLDSLHDIMYSRLCMSESLYREVLKRARTDLASAISKRNRLLELVEDAEKEMAQLKRLIGGIHAYVDESEASGDLAQRGEGLKEAVCTALRAANHDVTISEIVAILKELQFPIESHQNPLGSVYTTVTRLVADGDVVPGEPRGQKKTYRWRGMRFEGTMQIASALLLGKGLVKTTGKR